MNIKDVYVRTGIDCTDLQFDVKWYVFKYVNVADDDEFPLIE